MRAMRLPLKLLLPCFLAGQAHAASSGAWEREVLYQIFPRSFYDSNGDRVGDFVGLSRKLDYVAGLGATAILLQPILKSRLYHNYMADDFFQVDPSFGTNDQFFDLVRAAHRRHLKVILDMEIQYVADGHPWFTAAAKHPGTREARRVQLRSGFYGFLKIPTYDGRQIPIASVNTKAPEVLDAWKRSFLYWASPPGRPRDGVDGFRLDHMMDDLDQKHVDTHLFRRMWQPLERKVRRAKPAMFFVAEQADWGLGTDQFQKGGVDSVYTIPLSSALRSLDAGKIATAIRAELKTTPPGRTQLVFVEDHDVERFASAVKSDPGLLRLGAVFTLTSKGTPSIYYGQELGMKGVQLHGRTDGNDIPVRLAFRWGRDLQSSGTALWYGRGPWADPAFSSSGDGISVEEESPDPGSLLNFYRRLIRLRRNDPALSEGSEDVLRGAPPGVAAFVRSRGGRNVLVALNLSTASISLTLPKRFRGGLDLWTGRTTGHTIRLEGHGFVMLRLRAMT